MTRDDAVRIAAGRTLPIVVLRAAGVAVAAASFLLVPVPYAVVVVCLALVGAALPATFATWAALVVLVLTRLQAPVALDGTASALLAVVHLMHVIGGLQLALPLGGRIRLRALASPARRWLVLQVPAQALLLAALAATRLPLHGLVPAGAVAVAVAVVVLVMVVLVRALAVRR